MSGEPLPVPVDDLSGWWPLEEPLVAHGGSDAPIYTFVSQFAADKKCGLFGGNVESGSRGKAAAAPPSAAAAATAAADVEFLRGLDLERLMAVGAADAPLMRVMISPAVAAAATAGEEEEEAREGKHPAYDENNPPTPATLVADLKATTSFKSAIADLNDDGSAGPLPYLGCCVFDCADEVHEDEDKQYVFCTREDVVEAEEADAAAGEEYDDRAVVFRSRAQLAALRRHVLQQRVFFVLIHTERVFLEFLPEPRSSDVLLMALGASVATGNLVGVIAVQVCKNLCD